MEHEKTFFEFFPEFLVKFSIWALLR